MLQEQWQRDTMSIRGAGPMPNLGKSISIMTHSQVQHAPPLGNFTPIYDVPRVENTIDEQALRDFTIWILERMQVYAPITELGNAVAGVIPAIAVHATNGRFDVAFASPAKEQVEIATLRWRQPPWKTRLPPRRSPRQRTAVQRDPLQQPLVGSTREPVGT